MGQATFIDRIDRWTDVQTDGRMSGQFTNEVTKRKCEYNIIFSNLINNNIFVKLNIFWFVVFVYYIINMVVVVVDIEHFFNKEKNLKYLVKKL